MMQNNHFPSFDTSCTIINIRHVMLFIMMGFSRNLGVKNQHFPGSLHERSGILRGFNAPQIYAIIVISVHYLRVTEVYVVVSRTKFECLDRSLFQRSGGSLELIWAYLNEVASSRIRLNFN